MPGGWRAELRELFQNAYRAGARNVTLTQERNVLTFADDGVGCDEPQLLLAAGATGTRYSSIVPSSSCFRMSDSRIAALPTTLRYVR